MEKKFIISGFGGQGVVFAGKLLAEAAMRDDKLSTYFPSYGVAMRGGAAKCDVIVADEEIGSPVIDAADVVIAMSIEAKRKFEPLLRPEGLFVVNSSLVSEESGRKDIETIAVEATAIAGEMGNTRVATLICLGLVAGRTACVDLNSFFASLEAKAAKFGPELLALNKQALQKGWNF
jgi:2-oxoglutarate ferredoxin oxidoreductase subunit gamma